MKVATGFSQTAFPYKNAHLCFQSFVKISQRKSWRVRPAIWLFDTEIKFQKVHVIFRKMRYTIIDLSHIKHFFYVAS